MQRQPKITLRRPSQEDAATVATIQYTAWQTAYRDIMPSGFMSEQDITVYVANWQNALAMKGVGRYWLAEFEGSPCGFATYGPARDPYLHGKPTLNWFELVALNVHPNYWRQRIGLKLLQAVEADIQPAVTSLYLWVAVSNARARNFYRAAGFEPLHIQRKNTRYGHLLEEAWGKSI